MDSQCYILILNNGMRFLISTEERMAIMQQIESGKQFIRVGEDTLNTEFVSAIVPIEDLASGRLRFPSWPYSQTVSP